MKKLNNLLFVCFVLVVATGFAQTNKYGIRAGVGIPNLKSTDDNIYSKDYESVAGFDGSFFADFGITERFSIKAELGFSRKGGDRNGVQPIPGDLLGPLAAIAQGQPVWAEFDNKAVFSYIEIPILAKYEWSLNKWGVYINAGPYVDFIVSPKQITNSYGEVPLYWDEAQTIPVQFPLENVPPEFWPTIEADLTADTDINSSLSNMDFGIMGGIGFTYDVGENSEILFDMRGYCRFWFTKL